MIWKIISGGVLLTALAAPALAQDQCVVPSAPAIPDGAKATPAQIVSGQNDIKAFAAAADAYQTCIVREIGRQRDLAKQNNQEFDPGIQAALEAKAGAQKTDTQRLAAAWNASVQAFNDAQQRKPRQAGAPAAGGGGYGGGSYGGGGRY
jgi:hypothetical protein